MTEMELFIQTNQISQLLVSSTDTLGTHTSIYLTIVTGYILVAYLVGAKLTRPQVTIAAAIYLVAYIYEYLLITVLTRGLTIQSANLMALDPTLPVGMMQQAQAPP
ncbi:MAG: hypothetical protein ACI90U_000765 [Pseudomonadales bacterium]|jgi:hypothetical protein